MQELLLSGCALALLAFAAPCQEEEAAKKPEAAKKAAAGELVPDYEFHTLVGCDGRKKLSELRGQPVLIVNWTDTDFGRGAAERVESVGKKLVPRGLVLILHDSHGKKQEDIEASVMRLYPGSKAWLTRTQKLPIEYADNGPPPDVALIGVDGRLLIAGSYTSDMGKATKAAEAELARAKAGWGEHKLAKKARAAAFGQSKLGQAKALLDEALAAEPSQPELLEVQQEIESSRALWARTVTFLMEQGEHERALARAKALAESVAGVPEWESEAAALVEAFAAEDAKAELDADRKLAAILEQLEKRKPAKADADKLASFAKSCGAPKVRARAQHLADIAALAAK
jgi:hypothetical protein